MACCSGLATFVVFLSLLHSAEGGARAEEKASHVFLANRKLNCARMKSISWWTVVLPLLLLVVLLLVVPLLNTKETLNGATNSTKIAK